MHSINRFKLNLIRSRVSVLTDGTASTYQSDSPKHNIHKFHDIKPKLSHDNWVSWKQELLATARDRGLYTTIIGTDTLPTTTSPNITIVGTVPHIGTTPLTQLI